MLYVFLFRCATSVFQNCSSATSRMIKIIYAFLVNISFFNLVITDSVIEFYLASFRLWILVSESSLECIAKDYLIAIIKIRKLWFILLILRFRFGLGVSKTRTFVHSYFTYCVVPFHFYRS